MIGITVQAGATTLADGTDTGGTVIGDIVVNNERVIKEAMRVEALAVVVFGRGNKRNTVSLTIDQQFATHLAARQAQFEIGDTLADQADLTLTFTEGATTLTIVLPDAGWKSVGARYNGVSMDYDVEIVGGAFEIDPVTAGASSYYDGGTAGVAFSPVAEIIHGGVAGDGAIFYSTFDGGIAA